MAAEFVPEHQALSRISPATTVFLITPNNDADLAQPTNGISFSAAGALHIIDGDDNEVTIPSGSLGAGVIHPLRVKKVFATGTGNSMNLVGYA